MVADGRGVGSNRRIRRYLLLFSLLFIAGALGTYFLFFHRHTTIHVRSLSPDGLYMCEIVEETDAAQSDATVMIRRLATWPDGSMRPGRRGKPQYEEIYRAVIYNDSMARGAYMVEWQRDGEMKTSGVRILAPWGQPPFKQPPPAIEFKMTGWDVQMVSSSSPSDIVLRSP